MTSNVNADPVAGAAAGGDNTNAPIPPAPDELIQPFAVKHYLGSWERYAGRRNDKRRSREVYNMKSNSVDEIDKDDGVQDWLMGFCNLVGHGVAFEAHTSMLYIFRGATAIARSACNSFRRHVGLWSFQSRC
jgi:hypothetical protein